MNICVLNKNETMLYAAEELQKYLMMMDETLTDEVEIVLSVKKYENIDPMVEDIIEIDIEKMKGTISGSNERSVLMGVYNFLKSAGCLWVRPGKLGERIPKKKMTDHSCKFYKKADSAFRGECIEGAPGLENIIETVEFLPKINANLFMMEYIVPYNYISRWYKHPSNPYKEDEEVTFEDARELVYQMEMAIKKCGLQLHSLGHGYIFEPYGLTYRTREDTYCPDEEAQGVLAQIGGKRFLFKDAPNQTQFCMSNETARKKIVDYLVGYIENKPYIDFLHVWLSDSRNNHCECEECSKKIPTDFYVMMLNELDAVLTEKGIDTKLVFIMYTDTYWAPETVSLNNPGRFIMTTATTGRDRSKPYLPDRYDEELPAYQRNGNLFDVTMPICLSFADSWKNVFGGKKFLFEYHFWMDHYTDPGYMHFAKNIYDDVRSLSDIGFDGIMDDKTQRSYFPTGLPMAVYGETLFERELDLEAYTKLYFEKAFGADGEAARAYLEKVSAIFNPDELRVSDDIVVVDTGTGAIEKKMGFVNNPATAARLAGLEEHLATFTDTIKRNLTAEDPCVRESWRILLLHQDYCRHTARILLAMAENDKDNAVLAVDEMNEWLARHEDEFQPYLDLELCNVRNNRLMKKMQ